MEIRSPRQHHERVTELFLAACELEETARIAFIERECSGDLRLRRDVEALLANDSRGSSFLPESTGGGHVAGAVGISTFAHQLHRSADEPLPDTLGRYRITGVLGRGGMGIVYEAHEEHPKRAVALKVLRPEAASPAVLRRFDHEADILARLQHPGIARLYGVGVEQGRGFLAMELVRGVPLTTYAHKNNLPARARLELFAKVCDAVQHAHSRAVIHRDLKPANILVDESGEPRVLDFGVAKLTDSDAAAITQTAVGQLVGTLRYMSPEQVAGDPTDVDTRSDVYALGVILFELMSGRLPYQLEGRSLVEIGRIIQQEKPARLGLVVPALRGDIDIIIAKALEKVRERRYQSASELAEELRRVLRHETVSARQETVLYQLTRLAQRNKALTAAACFIVLLLAGSAITFAALAVGLERAKTFADQSAIQAQADSAAKQETLGILQNLTRQTRADARNTTPMTLREAIDSSANEFLARTASIDPSVEFSVLSYFATAYRDLGEFERALTFAKAAHKRASERPDPRPREAAEAASVVAVILLDMHRYEEAAPYNESVLRFARSDPSTKPEELAVVIDAYAVNLQSLKRFDDAQALFHENLSSIRERLGDNRPESVHVLRRLSFLKLQAGDGAAAETFARQAIQLTDRTIGDDSDDSFYARTHLLWALRLRGDADAALNEARLLVERHKRVHGETGPEAALALVTLGETEIHFARHAPARTHLEEALACYNTLASPRPDETMQCMIYLSTACEALGDSESAARYKHQSDELRARVLGPASPPPG